MRKYELAYIVHPDLENTLDKVTEKVNKYINAHGKVLVEDVWGKRKLAYPIAKQNFGLYVVTTAEMEPSAVGELEGLLRRTEEVIRFLVVSLVDVKVAEKKGEKPKKDALKKEEKTEETKAEEKTEEVKEEKTEKPKKAEKAKEEIEETEGPSEEARMEELDKKLKKILGEEEK